MGERSSHVLGIEQRRPHRLPDVLFERLRRYCRQGAVVTAVATCADSLVAQAAVVPTQTAATVGGDTAATVGADQKAAQDVGAVVMLRLAKPFALGHRLPSGSHFGRRPEGRH